MKHLAELPKYPGSACTKLIRRELVIENSLFFKKGLLSEDIDWTLALLRAAENSLIVRWIIIITDRTELVPLQIRRI